MYIRQLQFIKFLIIFSMFAMFCSGCGQKGDLTRPNAVKTNTSTTTDSQKTQAQ